MRANILEHKGDFIGYESITVNTAIGFTVTTLVTSDVPKQHAVTAFCRLETAQIRYRLDGTDPTTTEGILLEVGETLIVIGHMNLMRFRAIKTGTTNGVLKVQYGY